LLLPVLAKAKIRAVQSKCGSNLRQTGLAFRMFADEHDGRLPMQIPVRKGGSLEYISQGQTWRHFQPLSNYLVRADLLVCPADRMRFPTNWNTLGSSNLSYFAGVDATMRSPNTLLSGDRNLYVPGFSPPGILPVQADSTAYWTEEMHQYRGNVLFTDGRVEAVDSDGLQRTFAQQAIKPNH
jgi:prepilin-type processing-associated H-X9-DG protein